MDRIEYASFLRGSWVRLSKVLRNPETTDLNAAKGKLDGSYGLGWFAVRGKHASFRVSGGGEVPERSRLVFKETVWQGGGLVIRSRGLRRVLWRSG